MKVVQIILAYFTIGAVIAGGMRLAEWLIPAPESRIVFCLSDGEDSQPCKSLKDLKRK